MMTPHVHREALHLEVHARPYDRLRAPLILTRIGLLEADAARSREHLEALLRDRQQPAPPAGVNHLSRDLGAIKLRWEQHTEFQTWTFWRQLPAGATDFSQTALADLAPHWVAGLPGKWLIGLHVLILPRENAEDNELPLFVRRNLEEDSLVGCAAIDAAVRIFGDFRLHEDGFVRFVVIANEMSSRRLGRLVQRLVEVETYRLMALLGLPVAREVIAALASAERDLAALAASVDSAAAQDEPELLHQLIQLAAKVEGLYARTHARFSASAAYFELLQRRIDDLREVRCANLQTVREFIDRRVLPALQTCTWAARRQQALSERISRVSNLLRTRVDIEQQQSSAALLDAMNRRQKAQLLLQSAVEGLSVAAVTYYGSGLVGYLAKGASAAGLGMVAPEIAVATSIPVIAVTVWLGIRRLHHRVQTVVD